MTEVTANQPVAARAVTYLRPGGPEVIAVTERQVRAPQAGEVRIAVAAAAVNPADIGQRQGGYANQTFPAAPGFDAAGTVESVGEGVTRLKVGERVMAVVLPTRPEGGAQSEYLLASEASVVAIGDSLAFGEAATLPMNGLTALLALELAGLQEGGTLAVSGGAGLLASYVIALARARGLNVIADARPEAADLVRRNGANIVIERGPDFAAQIRNNLPQGVDALVDTAVLGESAFGALRDRGTYIPLRGWKGSLSQGREIEVKPLFVFHAARRTDWLELILHLAQAGKLPLRAVSLYPPERAAEAQLASVAGGRNDRAVIVFREAS